MADSPAQNPVTRFFRKLGPGLITGAADDDPSGIATYSVAGAQHGTALLWTALLTWPLMGCVQFMCARIGMVTGRGLAATLRLKFPKWLITLATFGLFGANTINIGADLSGMADSAEMLTGIGSHWFVPMFGVAITIASIKFRYQKIARILKWLALALLAYVIAGFLIHPDWSQVLRSTVIPTMPKGHEMWGTLVAILGTTISPYLFYWQSSQEVEEEKAVGRQTVAERRGASTTEIADRKVDVGAGTFASNFVMYFIILTTALTLHKAGAAQIETSRQAAEALRPLAGNFAAILFTAGVIGTGFLAIPTLAGSGAYAFAECFRWRQGLDETFRRARSFYTVFIVSVALGIALDLLHVNPIKALYWTAIINGLLAPFLLVGILIVACDRRIMQGQPSSLTSRVIVSLTTLLMFAAAIGMFVF
ncbi:MAG TPA: divalent metal cation transporter [Chthoniobacteraceae bacterium]|jgi:NRAMP (natural resistance-associated macrophage protein)-like metal ion transporter|nr:divalent metal cation transporter [Chthoniobacteraceae bacterium]